MSVTKKPPVITFLHATNYFYLSMSTIPNRNDPCYCGSGKKYKKCHMLLDAAAGVKPARKIQRYAKTPSQIEGMRRAGAFNGELMDYMRQFVAAGVSTEELDSRAREYTVGHGHVPACLKYKGYPKSI
jgi:methionyl aminopeptidase